MNHPLNASDNLSTAALADRSTASLSSTPATQRRRDAGCGQTKRGKAKLGEAHPTRPTRPTRPIRPDRPDGPNGPNRPNKPTRRAPGERRDSITNAMD